MEFAGANANMKQALTLQALFIVTINHVLSSFAPRYHCASSIRNEYYIHLQDLLAILCIFQFISANYCTQMLSISLNDSMFKKY